MLTAFFRWLKRRWNRAFYRSGRGYCRFLTTVLLLAFFFIFVYLLYDNIERLSRSTAAEREDDLEKLREQIIGLSAKEVGLAGPPLSNPDLINKFRFDFLNLFVIYDI